MIVSAQLVQPSYSFITDALDSILMVLSIKFYSERFVITFVYNALFMKTFWVCTVLIVYILVSSHVVLDLHYCGGDLVSWSFIGQVDKCCSKTCPKGCCEDLEVTFGSADNHVLSGYYAAPSENDYELADCFEHLSCERVLCVDQPNITFVSHPPPDLSSRKIYLLCEKFLI
jgi:hypothetical protein